MKKPTRPSTSLIAVVFSPLSFARSTPACWGGCPARIKSFVCLLGGCIVEDLKDEAKESAGEKGEDAAPGDMRNKENEASQK